MKEKIVSASKESRLRPDYPQELQPEYFSQNNICDKYLNNFNDSQIHTNGKIWAMWYNIVLDLDHDLRFGHWLGMRYN